MPCRASDIASTPPIPLGVPVTVLRTGNHILAHHPDSGGWHVRDLPERLRDGDYTDRLEETVTETRAPVLIVSFFDGELCAILGLEPGPDSAPWAARLHPHVPPTRYPTPKHRHLYPHPLPPQWMLSGDLLSGAAAVAALAGWSQASGGEPDRAGLAALLAEEPERFTEDVVPRLVDLLGLSEHVEPWYPHEFHGWDDPVKLERSITVLQPGRFRALDCVEHQGCYALVRRQDGGDYLIEYREPKSEALHQTVTPSLAEVVAAMNAWARGETRWRGDFIWTRASPPQ